MSPDQHRLCDLHIHTEHSSDASGTITQAAQTAAHKHLHTIAVTNHCPELPGHVWHDRLEKLERMKDEAAAAADRFGLRVLVGAEIEIIDFNGHLAAPDLFVEQCDLVIAAVHWFPTICYDGQKPQVDDYTTQRAVPWSMKMTVGAIRNPQVDIIAHIGYALGATKQPRKFLDQPQDYPELYIQQIAVEAARTGTAIEINHRSRLPHPHLVKCCLDAGCTFATGSDAHRTQDVGELDWSLAMVKDLAIAPDRLLCP